MAVLDVQNLTLSFGADMLFKDVSFSIKDKEKVGLIGCNGAGKTSLFKLIIGEYTADSGNCFVGKMSNSAICNSIPVPKTIPFITNLFPCFLT